MSYSTLNNNSYTNNKQIFVRINERVECIEFNPDTRTEDLRETLMAAAEANPNDILKLYTPSNNLIAITSKLPDNTIKEPYRLEIIVKNIVDHTNDLKDLIMRIESLEKQLTSFSESKEVKRVDGLNIRLKELCDKLENLEHLSFLGLFKDNKFANQIDPFGNHLLISSIKNIDRQNSLKQVYEQFKKYSMIEVNNETRQYLRSTSFDLWKFSDAELLVLTQQMFLDLALTSRFAIKMDTLQNFVFEVYANYNEVAFHNYRHAFSVAQMMFNLILLIKLHTYLDPVEIFSLIVSALCHDLDHQGFGNSFQINAGTNLALLYNDYSPLEMHHCAVAFSILAKQECNIASGLDKTSYRRFRNYVIQNILATDMANHNQILASFNAIVDNFDFKKPEHKQILMKILIKVSDISNDSRPIKVAEAWLDCLLVEFFNQGDHEKLNGLPISPLMDRNNFSRADSQIFFISHIVLPLVESLAKLFPQIMSKCIIPIKESLEYYQRMKDKVSENQTPTVAVKTTTTTPTNTAKLAITTTTTNKLQPIKSIAKIKTES